MESIPGSDMNLHFHGVKIWDKIWLAPYTDPSIDIAMGGITREEKRTENNHLQVVDYTHKTVSFMQSLLMHKVDAAKIKTHDDLTCAYVVGAVRGTTGEYRFLARAGIINDLQAGLIKKGTTVILKNKDTITSNGTLSIYNNKLKDRIKLLPGDCKTATVNYFLAEDSMIPALQDGAIDAIARGYIGNKLVADRFPNTLSVGAIFSLESSEKKLGNQKEEAVFYVKHGDQKLLRKLNTYIDYLTDKGKIGYEDWKKEPSIFMIRAEHYLA